ncbi:hypothetical protein GFPCMMHI_05481 [Ensifer adhaerens]|nr:hypothetical protein [Ensifer adhaerens]
MVALKGFEPATGIWSTAVDNGRWASNPGIPNAISIGMFEGADRA